MRSLFILILSFTLSISVFSQGEYNIWYFGNFAGMDFNGGAPVALTNGSLNTNEGSSSISDAGGNLLFYTDGISVWNSTHALMPNGTGLHGNSSSIQAALIIKQPGSSSIYYVFTTTNNANANGMKYSIVDMTLNGGLGDVTTKNVPLVTPCGEKLIAIPHSNCNDIWVLTHGYGNNTFYAYLVTSAGVGAAVTTNVGSAHNGGSPGAFNSALGTMKPSPDGTKIAVCDQYSDIFEVFDFDASTGVVSNTLSLSSIYRAFGTEFSDDGTKLYVTERQGSQMWQFNLAAGSAAAIQASKTLITSAGSYNYGALQRGPDGKIYLARDAQTSLGVINNPNALGAACNYVENGFNLGGMTCQEGLPTIAMLTAQLNLTVNNFINFDTTICLGESATLTVSGADTYVWSTGSTNNSITVSPTTTTVYTVTGTATGGCTGTISATVNVSPLPTVTATASPTSICTGQSSTLTASGANTYTWSTGGTGSSISVSPASNTTYTVTGTSVDGCTGTASVSVTVSSSPTITLTATPPSICEGESSTLTAGGATTYTWSTSATGTSITVNPLTTTTYTVTGSSGGTCTNTATIDVVVNPLPTISVSDEEICEGQTATLSASGGNSYIWSSGGTASTENVSPIVNTMYYVTGTDANGCSNIDSATVTVNTNPSVTTTTTPETCNGANGSATANPTGGLNPYLYEWSTSPAQTTNPATNLIAGTYTVTVTDDNGCTATADAIVDSQDGFTLSSTSTDEHCEQGDGTATVIVTGATSPLTYTWSHDPVLNSPNATGLTAGTYTVTVDDGTCQESIDITVYALPGPIAGFNVNPTQAELDNAFFTITDLSIGATSWLYYFDDGNSSTLQNPTHTYTSEGDYTITQYVYDDNGCADSTTMIVSVEGLFAFYVPNAFSPNGDNRNDYFLPKGVGINTDTWYMRIYDRWGRTVFVSTDINQPWDGEYHLEDINKTPTGVFAYYITFKTNAGLKMEYYGHVITLP